MKDNNIKTTGNRVKTPRGVFEEVISSEDEMRGKGWGLWFEHEDYLIMSEGSHAVAVLSYRDSSTMEHIFINEILFCSFYEREKKLWEVLQKVVERDLLYKSLLSEGADRGTYWREFALCFSYALSDRGIPCTASVDTEKRRAEFDVKGKKYEFDF